MVVCSTVVDVSNKSQIEDAGGDMMKSLLVLLTMLSCLAAGFAQQAQPQEESSPQIGLPAGEKAPPFSLRDQLGRVQTKETLKGAKGTVLVFFRSADW